MHKSSLLALNSVNKDRKKRRLSGATSKHSSITSSTRFGSKLNWPEKSFCSGVLPRLGSNRQILMKTWLNSLHKLLTNKPMNTINDDLRRHWDHWQQFCQQLCITLAFFSEEVELQLFKTGNDYHLYVKSEFIYFEKKQSLHRIKYEKYPLLTKSQFQLPYTRSSTSQNRTKW